MSSHRPVSRLSHALIGACAFLSLAGVAFAADAPMRQGRNEVDTGLGGDIAVSSAITTDDYVLAVEARGRVVLAYDGTGVAKLTDGDYFDFTMVRNGQTRRVRFAGRNGAMERLYWAADKTAPWSAEADAFVAEAMPIVFRETGLQAEGRTAYLLKESGPDGLLAEVEQIVSDGIQQSYIVAFAGAEPIADAEFRRLTEIAGAQIESDGRLGQTLAAVHAAQKPAADSLVHLVSAASSIDSDGEASKLLATLAASAQMTDAAAAAYLKVAGSIESDSEMRQALAAFLRRKGLDNGHIRDALGLAAGSIESDSEIAGLLTDTAASLPKNDQVRAAQQVALETIASESTRGNVAAALK